MPYLIDALNFRRYSFRHYFRNDITRHSLDVIPISFSQIRRLKTCFNGSKVFFIFKKEFNISGYQHPCAQATLVGISDKNHEIYFLTQARLSSS